MRQRIHLTSSSDNVRLAWTRAGSGPVLVKAANWFTHLRLDLESPVWRHWMEFLCDHFDTVRFDERGCGRARDHSGLNPGHRGAAGPLACRTWVEQRRNDP